jgi:uncharacterized protein (TIGR00269 family)
MEARVKNTIKKFNFCKKNQRVLVALSGGKDSSVVAYLLKKFGFNIYGVHIDLKMGKYSEQCLEASRKLCKNLGIKLHVYDMKKEMGSSMCYLRSHIQTKTSLKNCAICGVIKKWILNKQARKLKAEKLATGHNLDDEAQTFLINIFKGSPKLSLGIGPISKNKKNKKFIPRIKPLFYVSEKKIKEYSMKKKLPVVYDKCPCAIDSYRIQVREFLEDLPCKEKENIIKNSEKILKNFKEQDSKLNYCEICKEPARKKICKMCELAGENLLKKSG